MQCDFENKHVRLRVCATCAPLHREVIVVSGDDDAVQVRQRIYRSGRQRRVHRVVIAAALPPEVPRGDRVACGDDPSPFALEAQAVVRLRMAGRGQHLHGAEHCLGGRFDLACERQPTIQDLRHQGASELDGLREVASPAKWSACSWVIKTASMSPGLSPVLRSSSFTMSSPLASDGSTSRRKPLPAISVHVQMASRRGLSSGSP